MVDGHSHILNIAAGFPGSIHDSRVLDEGFSIPQVKIADQDVYPYLVGDSAYPLMQTILKPFSDSSSDPAEKRFNKDI